MPRGELRPRSKLRPCMEQTASPQFGKDASPQFGLRSELRPLTGQTASSQFGKDASPQFESCALTSTNELNLVEVPSL